MNDFLLTSAYWGALLSLAAFVLGLKAKERFQKPIFNPLLIAIILTMAFLLVFHIDYDYYYSSASILSYLLTPATVCLAVPLYEQFQLLKNNARAVIIGIASGVLTNLISVLLLAALFGLNHAGYVTMLPKTVTTAIGMGVTAELGGYVPITVASIVVTGIFGNMIAETVFRIARIRHPIAKGIALGTSSHAMGTVRAMEMGEVEGAMSSLSIVVAGILIVAGAGVFANFY